MYPSAGQTSDYIGAAALLSTLPKAKALLADRGCDANWFRNALIARDIQPCIPSWQLHRQPKSAWEVERVISG